VKAFIFGLGGGGDVVSAYIAYEYYKRLGYDTILGAVTWERYVEDPLPGPICEFMNADNLNDVITKLNKESYSIRNGRVVIPQIVKVLKVLNISEGYSICIREGIRKIARMIDEFALKEGIDVIVGVDAGGDVLAKGCEETLGSPLIDFIMLNVLTETKTKSVLATIGAGSDGELQQDYILRRIAEIATKGGLKDIKGIDEAISRKLDEILSVVTTEASKIPLEAFRGLYGEVSIRNNTRRVFVTPISAVMFFMEPKIVYETSPIAKVIKDSESLEDANEKLNKMGVYTEYNFELDLFSRFGNDATNVKGDEISKIRSEGKRKLGETKIKC